MDYFVKDFGAALNGKQDDTEALQSAIDACHAGGGGRVIIRGGEACLFATACLKDHVELHVERGGKMILAFETNAGQPQKLRRRGGIVASGARNIAITGAGEIDGNGKCYVTEELPQIYRIIRRRPFVVRLFDCTDVLVRDIHLLDGPAWTLTLFECTNVTIDNVTIYNDMKMPNSDAIDLCHCRNVRVSNSHLESGDDCIVLKTMNETGNNMPCENITVTNCTMTSRSFAINLGCEVSAPIRNCVFDNITIYDSHRGIGIHQSRASVIENVSFVNCTVETRHFDPDWWGAGEPIYVVAIPWTTEDTVGPVRDIYFKNIICRSESGVLIYGDADSIVDNIVLDDVWVNIEKFTDEPGGRMDFRPCDGAHTKLPGDVYDSEIAAFRIHNAENVTLRGCGVRWIGENPGYYVYAVDADQTKNLSIEHFRGTHAKGAEEEAIRIR